MLTKVISILTDPNHRNWLFFRDNMIKRGWQPVPIVIPTCIWMGNVDKIFYLKRYLKKNNDREFLCMDAYDMAVLGTPEEFEEKRNVFTKPIVFSTEKNCWPNKSKESLYPESESTWKYLNAGQFFGNSSELIQLIEKNNLPSSGPDQWWIVERFLKNQDKIELDYNCVLFQNLYMQKYEDFYYKEGRLYNTQSKSCPIFIHGSGKADMGRVYGLTSVNYRRREPVECRDRIGISSR